MDNLSNKSLKCLNLDKKYNTFEDLSNCPQLSSLFVLKQKIQKGKFTRLWERFLAQCKIVQGLKNSQIHDLNVDARASMKSFTYLSTYYECDTSPKQNLLHKFQNKNMIIYEPYLTHFFVSR